MVRPIGIGIGIHSYVASVVLMAVDRPSFWRSFHFHRSDADGDSQSDVTSRRRRGSLERSGLGFQEIVKTPGHLLAE